MSGNTAEADFISVCVAISLIDGSLRGKRREGTGGEIPDVDDGDDDDDGGWSAETLSGVIDEGN
ncbi:hypothetical protein EYF80_067019 [Liparis tanakae]|uniref:Uncharacterized protein n=1 Tax=Liparis tanakae TaxID=230148 RepID=A0A4Z2E262_9TELE|nr:hypothetical protein EYF80_067019 [Liparis tanakae]